LSRDEAVGDGTEDVQPNDAAGDLAVVSAPSGATVQQAPCGSRNEQAVAALHRKLLGQRMTATAGVLVHGILATANAGLLRRL